jgi:hypothetical protein
MIFREFIEYTFKFLVEAALRIISFILSWSLTFRTVISHQRPFSFMYDILSLTNCTHLNADTILLCTKNLNLIYDSHSPFHIQMYVYSLAGSVPPLSHLTSCSPTKSNLYFDISSSTLLSEPYITSTKSQVPFSELRPFIQSIRPGPRPFVTFRNKFIFTVKNCQPHVQPPNWRISPSRLSIIAYSIYSQLSSISGGRHLHPQPEEAPCRGDKGSTSSAHSFHFC